MGKVEVERKNIKVRIETIETVEGITWWEVLRVTEQALRGLGYYPEALDGFLEGHDE